MLDEPRKNTFMEVVQKFAKEIAGIFGAILLSAIVTILLSRISETQLLIKVSIADFWGAIAIGFVANYLGARGLEKLLPQSGSSSAQVSSTTPLAEEAAPAEKVLPKEDIHATRKGK